MRASFERIDALFHAALARPESEREAFLEQACGDDRALRERLRAMLAHDAGEHDPLADAVAAGRREFRPAPETMPERIGPFRMLRRLGRGGMGTVWLGQRESSDFRQQVAIKLLRNLDGAETIHARLRRERRLLARLEHPHIARLVDGGELADGTPWVAMEYVEGVSLTAYAGAHTLDIPARLRLFLQLLDAVAYAHRHLIVHRDIKPDNVLVDTDGTLKLLDFGIAKLLEDEAAAARHATLTVAGAMTPSYASPEQLMGQTVSTQSDVYSLGVVLYELLTGSLPFPPDASVSQLELQNRICTTQAPPPSRVQAPALPRRRLRGDLDNIVLKALRKEPQRRYASADALAEDVCRHLDGRPVSARPDSWRYRSSKFVARNPAGVAVSVALLVTLLAFAVTSRWQAVRLAAERDRARTEAAAAKQVADYMIDLFRVPDPLESAHRDLSARDMLDKAAASLSGNVDKSPALRARMMHVIGLSYANIGAYQPAVRMLRDALAIRERTFGPDSFEVSDSLNRLGNIYRMYGHLDLAEPALTRALAIRRQHADGPDLDLADAYNNVGLLQYQLGHYADALVMLDRSVAMHRAVSGTDTEAVAIALNNRALALAELARYTQAEAAVRQAIAIKHGLGLDARSTMANSQALLASLMMDRGRLRQALALRTGTLAARRALYPDGHPALVAGLVGMGRLQMMLGHAGEAARYLGQARRQAVRLDTGSHLLEARVLEAQGRLALATGDIAAARKALDRTLQVRRSALADDHPALAEARYLDGLAMLASADTRQAGRLLVSALQQRAGRFPRGHPAVRETRLALAALDEADGRHASARRRLQTILADAPRERSLRGDLITAQAQRCLATLPAAHGSAPDPAQAERALQAAQALLAGYLPDGHPLLGAAATPCIGTGWLAADAPAALGTATD